jgi:acetaldehyde dehydrogenase / alcohol dehydrogenase
MGYVDKVTKVLDSINVHHQVFYHVEPDPTLACIYQGLQEINEFKPDVIIAIGGGSPMDAAKIMWLLYEEPDIEFEGIATRFMDIRKRVYSIPEIGKKAEMICIPTTSGTGSEVTPFSVVTDEKTGNKYPLADYALTPQMAIIDPFLVLNMPKQLTAYGGIDALTHAIESYVSICATDFSRGLSREALTLLFKYLPRSYKNGSSDYDAKEKVHYAATLAGMAFANAFLGICHSMAHKLGAVFHIPHGLANALLISHVIRYNATEVPFKQATFPQYRYPNAVHHYVVLAKLLGIQAETEQECIDGLIAKVEELKRECDIPTCIKEYLGEERYEEYKSKLPELAEQAFDDQCTSANPRYPLIADLEKLMLDAWEPLE